MNNLFRATLAFSKYALLTILLLAIVSALIYSFKTPSNDRQWAQDQARNSTIQIDDQQHVFIDNVRDIDWFKDQGSAQKHYRKLQFDLSELKSLKVAVSHFSAISELAHVFLMFELNDDQSFGFSIEARREDDEEYTLTGGLLARYELVYLIATEDDLLGLRKTRDEKVYLYPIKTTPDKIQELFRMVMKRTNEIDQNPEFYHLFFKNCTTQTVDLVDQISDRNYPELVQAFMPGDTGKALFKMGLIDTMMESFENVQKAALAK